MEAFDRITSALTALQQLVVRSGAAPKLANAIYEHRFSVAAVAAILYGSFRLWRFWSSDCDAKVQAALGRVPKQAFAGKVVLITGASSGIGEALAYSIAESGGATVVLAARRMDRLTTVAEKCFELGAKEAYAVKLDVLGTPAAIEAVVQSIVRKYGRIDVLCNNAGRSQRGLVERTSVAIDRELFEVNVFGVLAVTHAVLPCMLAQGGGGSIMNTLSAAGKIGSPCSATYAATKGALASYFDSLRMETHFRGIRVVNVHPGPVRSEITMHAFTETQGKELGHPTEDSIKRVTADRCASLMVAALHANLPEVWIAPQPILSYMYLAQYLPGLFALLAPRGGQRRVEAYLNGQTGYDSVQSVWGVLTASGKASAPSAQNGAKKTA